MPDLPKFSSRSTRTGRIFSEYSPPYVCEDVSAERLFSAALQDIADGSCISEDEAESELSELSDVEGPKAPAKRPATSQRYAYSNAASTTSERNRKKRQKQKVSRHTNPKHAEQEKKRRRKSNKSDFLESKPVVADVDAADMPAGANAWTALPFHQPEPSHSKPSRNEAPIDTFRYQNPDINLLSWDGQRPFAAVDRKRRSLAIFVGTTRDHEEWIENNEKPLAELLESIRKETVFCDRNVKNKRGEYAQVTKAVVLGGGGKEPLNSSNGAGVKLALGKLLQAEEVQRTAGVGDSTFKEFLPDMYTGYKENKAALLEFNPNLEFPLENSVFAAITFNLGPQTITYKHRDHKNLVGGGHIVLWDLKLVVEFPPGSIILIPSALICHSNVGIAPKEKRYSIMMYTSGHLFHFVNNRCKTDRDLVPELSEQEFATRMLENENRWDEMLKMFKVWDFTQQ